MATRVQRLRLSQLDAIADRMFGFEADLSLDRRIREHGIVLGRDERFLQRAVIVFLSRNLKPGCFHLLTATPNR